MRQLVHLEHVLFGFKTKIYKKHLELPAVYSKNFVFCIQFFFFVNRKEIEETSLYILFLFFSILLFFFYKYFILL